MASGGGKGSPGRHEKVGAAPPSESFAGFGRRRALLRGWTADQRQYQMIGRQCLIVPYPHNIMQQLTLILEQRRRAISSMSPQAGKFQLIEQQRKRSERENWILRVLKSLKVLSVEQKRAVLATTLRLMQMHRPDITAPPEGVDTNFLETMINLFVDFFNGVESADVAHFKAIIRPNNNYIVVDLLRTLVQMGRKEFKAAMAAQCQQQIPLTPTVGNSGSVSSGKKLSVRSLVKLPPLRQEGRGSEHTYHEMPTRESEAVIGLQTKLRYALMQKYSRAVQGYNFQSLQSRANQLYLDLLYLNQRNSLRIQKYLDGCFGARRHINYDASGLYTQEEMKRLVDQQQQRTSARISQVGELKGDCTSEQLKEYFKMQVELQVAMAGLRGFARHVRLRPWFPLALLKNGDKLHPLQLVVDFNGVLLPLEEFEQRSGKRVRNYLRESLLQARGQNYDQSVLHHPQYLRYPKKDLISYQQAKVLQLLNQDAVVMIGRKDPILPSLPDGQLRRKVKSETKIGSRSVVLGGLKMEREVEKRLNFSSMVKEGKGRIEAVIDRVMREGDCR